MGKGCHSGLPFLSGSQWFKFLLLLKLSDVSSRGLPDLKIFPNFLSERIAHTVRELLNDETNSEAKL